MFGCIYNGIKSYSTKREVEQEKERIEKGNAEVQKSPTRKGIAEPSKSSQTSSNSRAKTNGKTASQNRKSTNAAASKNGQYKQGNRNVGSAHNTQILKVTFDNGIRFAPMSYQMSNGNIEQIKKFAEVVKNTPEIIVVKFYGYVDAGEIKAGYRELAYKRANEVAKIFCKDNRKTKVEIHTATDKQAKIVDVYVWVLSENI